MATSSESPGANALLLSEGKRLATQIFLKTLAAIDVPSAMRARLRLDGNHLVFGEPGAVSGAAPCGSLDRGYSLRPDAPPLVIAFGKAAVAMANSLHEILGGKVRRGLVVAPTVPDEQLDRFQSIAGGHPYPNEGSRAGARAALDIVSGLCRNDAVIFLISGGGSALLEEPDDPAVTLADLVEFNRALVTSELPIERINVLRKHVSAVKGGRLAERAFPAAQLTVFISDVPEAVDSMVASGPTWPDDSSVDDCYAIATDYHLAAKLPPSLRRRFEKRTLVETPKPGDASFERSLYWRLLSNRDAVQAARAAAEELGFVVAESPRPWDADFREVARASSTALDALAARHPGRAVCLVAGGEVTCPVTGPGRGGRNQAFALYAVGLIAGQRRVVMSAGTDGHDGNSPAAGAVSDGETLARAQLLGLDPEKYLAASDSHEFFRALGQTIETGQTANNVRDVRLWIDLGA
jgi:glycerate 2-kinase